MPPMAFTGVVIRQGRMNKTVTVTVRRQQIHKRTGKLIMRGKNFLVHDEKNELLVDDTVRIRNCPPISKRKRFTLEAIISSPERDARTRHTALVDAAAEAEARLAADAEARAKVERGEVEKVERRAMPEVQLEALARKVREAQEAAERAAKELERGV